MNCFIKQISIVQNVNYIYNMHIFCRMSEKTFEIARLLAVIITVAIKLYLMPWYLQAYLDMAYHRTEEQKKEAGRITNIEFQKKVQY